ncbi:MAG: chorismate transformation enzyme, FkbO/Hyg5 family [Panacagrimonas sp.]
MPDAPAIAIRLDVDAASSVPALAQFDWLQANAASVPLPCLNQAPAEAWVGSAAPTMTQQAGLQYGHDGTWLIGHLRLDADDVEHAAYQAYRKLGDFLAASDYPYLLRAWNFLDRLNQGEGDSERYRRFCIGRHRAIAQPGFEARLPAATVIGSDQAGLVLSFLAAREPGLQIENPRQTSAFQYPRDYGPVSPSFSRATLVGPHLLVSGTAAVVGHATRPPFDALAQTDEITANLEALLVHARSTHLAGVDGRWSAQALRLYVRQAQDAEAATSRLRNWIPASVPLSVLRGDISRADLMVEVEGVWSFTPAT